MNTNGKEGDPPWFSGHIEHLGITIDHQALNDHMEAVILEKPVSPRKPKIKETYIRLKRPHKIIDQ